MYVVLIKLTKYLDRAAIMAKQSKRNFILKLVDNDSLTHVLTKV